MHDLAPCDRELALDLIDNLAYGAEVSEDAQLAARLSGMAEALAVEFVPAGFAVPDSPAVSPVDARDLLRWFALSAQSWESGTDSQRERT